jgi:hypothetical protein
MTLNVDRSLRAAPRCHDHVARAGTPAASNSAQRAAVLRPSSWQARSEARQAWCELHRSAREVHRGCMAGQ